MPHSTWYESPESEEHWLDDVELQTACTSCVQEGAADPVYVGVGATTVETAEDVVADEEAA